MDTIIYIYKKRDLQKPAIDSVQMKDYQLVRVGLDVGEGRWFSHTFTTSGITATEQTYKIMIGKRSESLVDIQSPSETMPKALLLANLFRASLREFRKRHDRIRFEKQQRRKFQDVREQVYSEIKCFLTELASFVDDRYECRCVYADTVRKILILPEDWKGHIETSDVRKRNDGIDSVGPATGVHWLPWLWQQCWQYPEFDDYLQAQWVEPLLENARLHRFVVLGLADSTNYAVLHCAPRMKSLRWILRESEDDQRFRDFVEDFYTEYGLAAAVQTLEGDRVFARLLLETGEPVCVLDFTGEPRIPVNGLARGSIWIDFCSVEEKARRIIERGEGIFYFSMKEIWKRTGKP